MNAAKLFIELQIQLLGRISNSAEQVTTNFDVDYCALKTTMCCNTFIYSFDYLQYLFLSLCLF